MTSHFLANDFLTLHYKQTKIKTMIKKYLILFVVGAFIFSLVIGLLGAPFSLTDPKMIGAIIFLFCFPFSFVYKDYKAIEEAKEQYPNKNISLAYSEELIINNPKSDCIGIILKIRVVSAQRTFWLRTTPAKLLRCLPQISFLRV